MRRCSLATILVLGLGGCGAGPISVADGAEATDDESTGDGDATGGDASTGDGDGDSTGDGDGDPSGDGDGDGMLPVSGDFLLAIETTLGPDLPLQFIAALDFELAPNGVDWLVHFSLQSLSLDQGSTLEPRELVGRPLIYPGVSVVEGEFLLDLGLLHIPGITNPITGSDVELTALLIGERLDGDGFCGELVGALTFPLEFDLTGSTFAAVRVADTSPAGLPQQFPYRCDQLPP